MQLLELEVIFWFPADGLFSLPLLAVLILGNVKTLSALWE